MPVLQLLLLAGWTLIVARLAAWRATLSNRTFATYAALGAFGGAVAVGLVQRLLTPYGETQPFISWLVTAGRQAVLLLPVLVWFFGRPAHRAATVADAFLLAFCVGFGFDLSGALLTASASPAPLRGFAWLPPWQYHNGQLAGAPWAAGSGYWTGLVAMAIAAGLRFPAPLERLRTKLGVPRNVNVAAVLGAAAFLWVVAEQTSVLTGAAGGVYQFFRTVVFAGRYTAWLTMGLLVALSIAEIRRQQASETGHPASWDEAVRKSAGEFRRRAVDLAAPALALRSRRPARASTSLREQVTRRLSLPVILWGLLAIFFFALPILPPNAALWWWTFPLMSVPLPVIGLTLFNTAVAVLLLHWYLSAPPVSASAEPPDAFVRAGAEETILHGGLGVIVLLLLHSAAAVYPFYSVASAVTGAALPAFTTAQAPTFLLLLAAATASLAGERTAQWRAAPVAEQRVAVLRRWRVAASAFAIAWASLLVYLPLLGQIHARLGTAFFAVGRVIGLPGNFLAAMLAAAITAVFAWGVMALLRSFGPFDDGEAARHGLPRVIGWLAGVS